MEPQDRYCSAIFDEMSISTNVQYNKKEDLINGVEDLGSSRRPVLADHVTVFMIKGILRGWKQPISYIFTNGPMKTFILKQKIVEIVAKCQQTNKF